MLTRVDFAILVIHYKERAHVLFGILKSLLFVKRLYYDNIVFYWSATKWNDFYVFIYIMHRAFVTTYSTLVLI